MSEPQKKSTDSFSNQVRDCANRISESGAVAVGGLFDLTAARLVRFSITITRNQHDAEDAVQSTLARIASGPKLLQRATNPWAYLLQMVRNESLLILRRRKRTFSIANLCDLVTRVAVDEVEKEETHRKIWLALRKLPVEQSEVVVLKIWEELTFAQIAEVLSATPATVASRYRYAMSKLSRSLNKSSLGITHGGHHE